MLSQLFRRDPGVDLGKLFNRLNESQHAAPGPINQSRPNADPQLQTSLSSLSFAMTGRLVLGLIVDTCNTAGVYKLHFENMYGPAVGFALGSTSYMASGVKEIDAYVPGSIVLCFIHNDFDEAMIIGALPRPSTAPERDISQIIFGSSRARVDDGHYRPILTPRSSGISDFTSGRALDGGLAGEKGLIAETGVRDIIDAFMAVWGLNEATGITATLYDRFLRMAAYNFHHFTSGFEREGFNDAGEYNDWSGYAPYPHEQLGLFRYGPALKRLTAQQWQKDSPDKFAVEPVDPMQKPWHRERVFHGYLGNLYKHLFQTAPTSGDKSLYGTAPVFPGLADLSVAMNGAVSIRSAVGLSFTKTAAIISPTLQRRPEQPVTGDDVSNYKAAGLHGDGPDHEISGAPRVTGNYPELQRAQAVMDLHAHLFNFQSLHAFAYHAKDYRTPEEDELDYLEGETAHVFDFSILARTAYLSASEALRSVRIDHRYGQQDLYSTQASVTLLTDGGVVVYDAFGSQLLMTGGSVWLDAPGDINLRAGRNIIQWAGDSAICRAKQAVDISSTKDGVRIAAGTDMAILGGRSGVGGVLVESQSKGLSHAISTTLTDKPTSTGVTIRSEYSDVSVTSAKVYLRSLHNGPIYLDAGSGVVSTIAAEAAYFVTSGLGINFGTDDAQRAAWFGQGSTVLASTLSVDGAVYASRGMICRGNVQVSGGTVATQGAKSDPRLQVLDGKPLDMVNEIIADIEQNSQRVLPDRFNGFYRTAVEIGTRGPGAPGNEDVIAAAGFSFRRENDYRTDDMVFPESRWQQLARLSGKDLPVWEEEPATYRGLDTYPYPGRKFFVGSEGLLQQDLRLFDAENGRSRRRGQEGEIDERYRSPELAQPRIVSLNEYRVIR